MTLLELLVVIVVISVLALIYLSVTDRNVKARALRIQCMNNLKQVGLASRIWEGDHSNCYPQAISETNGGTMEFTTGPNAFRHFQVLSNELGSLWTVFCPGETDTNRFVATNFVYFSNSNLSYFVSLNVTEADPQCILSGDRNLTNGTPLKNGILELSPNKPGGWTSEMHNKAGNILLADGSVQRESSLGLGTAVTNAILFTNRLLIPELR